MLELRVQALVDDVGLPVANREFKSLTDALALVSVFEDQSGVLRVITFDLERDAALTDLVAFLSRLLVVSALICWNKFDEAN